MTTTADSVPLKYGMRAHYITHAETARQHRAHAGKAHDNQLQFEEPQP